MVELADIRARIEALIDRADQVEVRLATWEWVLRQQSLLLEEYVENFAEHRCLFDEQAAWLKSEAAPRPGKT